MTMPMLIMVSLFSASRSFASASTSASRFDLSFE